MPPMMIPRIMETGICNRVITDMVPVEAKEVNAVKRTITKTSSTDAPDSISYGIIAASK